MNEVLIPKIDLKKTSEEFKVNSRLKICLECGHSNLDVFEFGISCEFCGSLFVFSDKKQLQNRREV